MSAQTDVPEKVLDFARQLGQTIDEEIGETPPLIQHLPDWEKFDDQRIGYAVSLPVLKSLVRPYEQPILDAVSFEGGAEAAVARYDDAQLAIVEFTTPQYATENDERIRQRLAELRTAGERVPTAYRRVGNYAVFVFGAADERAANALIDQVKYEKDIRWLGTNPFEQKMRESYYTITMGGVVITALKATAVGILICLGVGGIFGGVIFYYRRKRATESGVTYSDAGGMQRLNIEDLNSPRPSSKLIGEGGET